MNTQPLRESPPLVNLQAEQRLLGAILVNNRSYDLVAGKVKPEHFYEPLHGRIFKVCAALIERGQIVNPVRLKNLFEADKDLAEIGGTSYLARLSNSAVTTHADQYGGIVTDLAMRRRAVDVVVLGAERVSIPAANESAADAIAAISRDLDGIIENGGDFGLDPMAKATAGAIDGINTAYRNKGTIQGVPTGILDLDRKLGGLRPGNLVFIAGRPSMGKSSLAVNVALGAARAGYGVPYFSAEMSKEELATFFLASITGIAIDRLDRGELDANDFSRLIAAQRDLDVLPIFINDRPRPSVSEMRAQARVLSRRSKCGLIIVDHVQIVRGDRRTENRTQELTEITGALKQMAKETNCAVIALSQLSREVEKREDKRPMLSDLRESGSIEQDADAVIFLYRHEYYLEREQPKASAKAEAKLAHSESLDMYRNRCEAIFAKQRRGPVGKVDLYYDDAICRFGNLAETPREPVGELI